MDMDISRAEMSFEHQGKQIVVKPIDASRVTNADLGVPSAQSSVAEPMKHVDAVKTASSFDGGSPPLPPKPDTTVSAEPQMEPKEPVVWTELNKEEKVQAGLENLRALGFPEDQLKEIEEVLTESQDELKPPDTDIEQHVSRENPLKEELTKKQLAGIGMLFLVSAVVDSHGTAHLLEHIATEYLSKDVMPKVLERLGFDKDLLLSLHGHRFDLGRGLLQMEDRSDVLHFLSGLSKYDTFDLLDSLDDHERTELLSEGRFEGRTMLSKNEIKFYFLDRLTSKQKEELHLETH